MNTVQQLQRANPGFLDSINHNQIEKTDTPEEIQRLWNHFRRYTDLNDRRIKALQEEIVRKDKILKEVQDFVMRAKDKQTVQNSRETLFRQNNTSRAPIETPIDRNGVSPADVQLEKIFYTGR